MADSAVNRSTAHERRSVKAGIDCGNRAGTAAKKQKRIRQGRIQSVMCHKI